MRVSNAVLLFATLAIAQPAEARDWPDAGGFTILEADEWCALTSEYKGPGESTLTVVIRRAGKPMVRVENYNWSAADGEKYEDISFRLNGKSYSGGMAMGTKNEGRSGFMMAANEEFLQDFAASSYFHVYKGEQIIDRLDLAGSAAAVAAARKCVAYVDGLRSAEEREKRKYEDLPKDPFAK